METKYKCKRCGKVVAIKLPNCPKCSSCDGYDEIPEPIPHLKYVCDELGTVEVGGYFTYTRCEMFQKGIRISEGMMVPVGLKCKTIEAARKQS